MKKIAILLLLFTVSLVAQNNTSYWQQHATYQMEIDINVENFQYTGNQKLTYTNNSTDTLRRVFYHLYFNAFQPGSEMDIRSRTIEDPDKRVGDRIAELTNEEIGYLKIDELLQNNEKVSYKVAGTILEVDLNAPMLPGESHVFDMNFKGQVPIQIRRSGRNSDEGVALSMTQWYPKLAEYDFEGWHADPYIGREFHGVWGDFDVKIKIDSKYTIGGTGYLQNPNEIGHGYQTHGKKVKHKKGSKLTWHFVAPMVHDFAWGADPEFIHDSYQASDGTMLHFFYKDKKELKENWKNLPQKTEEILLYFNEHIGPYPYEQYSVIQGGDGGMEYAMCTLITGDRTFESLVGVTAHELAHSWFQHVLATNESKHEWMDEGMTTYISTLAMDKVMDKNTKNPMTGSYRGYRFLANSPVQQPLSTHADRWDYNQAYGISAYSKGAIFVSQLGYILGEDLLAVTLKKYYQEWRFKHPTPNDFKRVAEKVSGAQLEWYLVDWTQTINTIDYSVKEVVEGKETTKISLERKDLMPMPIEARITYMDGTSEDFYIPLQMMRWIKPNTKNVQKAWAWAMPTYEFEIPTNSGIKSIQIDPSGLMADKDLENNLWEK